MRITFSFREQVEELEFEENTSLVEVEQLLVALFPSLAISPFTWNCNGKQVPTKSPSATTLKQLNLDDSAFVLLEQQHDSRATVSSRNVRPRSMVPKRPIYFPGMRFVDVLEHNPNPLFAVRILRSHPELLREMSFHNAQLAEQIQTARSESEAAEFLREIILSNEVTRSMKKFEEDAMEESMKLRLKTNKEDQEAQTYFQTKENEGLLKSQFDTVMEEYPETLFPVLMLYIHTKVNHVDVKAFVDSGAQTSVMTLACAQRCGIAHLIDKKYAGTVMGVGTSATLGKIFIAPIQIGHTFFQMSVTVLDQLGDKNMEFLLGLDMLKRHRCSIDLEFGVLRFHGAQGATSTPFLHEKDLPVSRGGTQGIEIDTRTGMQVVKDKPDNQDQQEEEKVQRLMKEGFSRDAVLRVLRNVGGDEDTALTCLTFEQDM